MESFISDADDKIKHILSELGWSMNFFKTQSNSCLTTCPINAAHRLRVDNLETHLETCGKTIEDLEDKPLPASIVEGPSTVQITSQMQEKIIQNAQAMDPLFIRGSASMREVPQTSNQYMNNFTRDERRALYDYVIANTHTPAMIPDLLATPASAEEKRELSAIELAIAERDAKRRRATYRNKVHTNRKTHTEVMREVIQSQMTCLQDDTTASTSVKSEPPDKQLQKKKEMDTREFEKKRESDSREFEKRRESDHAWRNERLDRDRFRLSDRSYDKNRSRSRDDKRHDIRHNKYIERGHKRSCERDRKSLNGRDGFTEKLLKEKEMEHVDKESGSRSKRKHKKDRKHKKEKKRRKLKESSCGDSSS